MQCRCMECDIARMTFGVRAYREYLEFERELGMAMQLKGLRAKATTFRAVLDDVGKAYDEGANAATLHAGDVRSLAAEFKDLKDDLDFAIGTVGNSSAVTGAGEPKEKPPEKPLVTAEFAALGTAGVQEGLPTASQLPGSTASTEPGI